MQHFKQELMEYLDYYNNCRIKAKLKGLPPAILNTSPFGCLNNFTSKYCLTFGVTHVQDFAVFVCIFRLHREATQKFLIDLFSKGRGFLGQRPKSSSADDEIYLPSKNQDGEGTVQWTIPSWETQLGGLPKDGNTPPFLL